MDDSNEKSSQSTSNINSSNHNSNKTNSFNVLNYKFEKINENSYFDKNLNEKIVNLLIGNHPLLPMKSIEKIAYCNFMSQNCKNKDFYNIKVIDEIIHNESTHIVAEFKDYLIKGDISEFLQQYYKKKESLNLLPKIYEYYISCSVIFPNYVALPESQYIYKNIQRKQRVIDIQQEQEDKEENIKNGLIEQEKEQTVFTTQAFDSILNQTDTSGVKQYFGISTEASKGGMDTDMVKLLNNIEKAEKKININKNNSKKKMPNISKLKKANNNELLKIKNTILLNEGYNIKVQNALHKKNGTTLIGRKNSSNNIGQNQNKNSFKQQSTENNNHHKKRNNFSTQITFIDSCNNQKNNFFDIKDIESIKKLNKNSKNFKEKLKDKDVAKQLYKNNSQTYQCLKNLNSNEKTKDNYYVKPFTNRESSGNFIANQSNKQLKKEKNYYNNNIQKEYLSRNSENFHINSNIKTYFEDPFKTTNQNKNTITSYKTKSQNRYKDKPKGYQTSRNKYENKNMYINVSINNAKSNMSNDRRSLDIENNNFIKRKNINHNKNKHNNLKNNLINALLGCGNNNQRRKINKYKDILIQKDINNSFVDSIDLNNIKDNNNDRKINKENNNDNDMDNSYNNKQKDFDDKISHIFLYNNEKNNSQSKRIISASNLDSNNKISSSSCTKAMSINSYGTKPKNSESNINSINHKKQISMSKIPTSFENRIFSHQKSKQVNEEFDNKNRIKEFIDNYLDDNISYKIINNFSSTESKNFNQENYNKNGDNKNLNNNNCFIEVKSKSKTKNKSKHKKEVLSLKNLQEQKKEKDNKIRNSIFNFEKRITKKLSEKKFNIFDKFKTKNSPKNNSESTKKTSSVRNNKSGNVKTNERDPLSARESNSKYQINAEMIELLSNKIQKIKQIMKETSDKGSNSISSILKKKKIPSAGRKSFNQPSKKGEEFLEKKTQNSSKTRNKKNNNGFIGVTTSNSNLGINSNLVNTIINCICQTNLLSPHKKNIEYDKLIKTFQKFKNTTNSFNGTNHSNNSKNNNYINSNNINSFGKKDFQKKKKQEHARCNSIYNANNNYENHFNIEVNIKNNLRVQSKKSFNNINNKYPNDNLNSLNINFNNYTNNYNYNYNYNINDLNNNGNINIDNINYNNSIGKDKSSSQKVIASKIINKNDNNLKGIPINGFDKLINKKYDTRNYNIPMSATDRIKQSNIYSTSAINNNTYSNRHKNSNSRKTNSKRGYFFKK